MLLLDWIDPQVCGALAMGLFLVTVGVVLGLALAGLRRGGKDGDKS